MMKHNKKAAKALAVSMFAVGFVTPLMFSNIAEAANFGKGGTGQWLSNGVLDKTDATKWATTTGTAAANYVMLDGYKFKIVAVDNATAGKNAKVTLWSYDKETHEMGEAGFGTAKYVSSGDSWGTANNPNDVNKAYAAGGLADIVDSLIDKFSIETQGRIQTVTLADETKINGRIGCDYKTEDGSADLTAKVWLPSWTEINDSGTWGLSNTNKRKIDVPSLLRSPYPDDPIYVVSVGDGGESANGALVSEELLLRPALQILNQTSWVFTTNSAINTEGVFTANGDNGQVKSYVLNNKLYTPMPMFTPSSGVILDGTKISFYVEDSYDTDYVSTGLLTTNSGTTWKAINTGDNANIAYMAQVSSGQLDLKNVTAGTDYNLKIFGLKTEDTTVTELADNAVQGLSIGSDNKIHMKIGGTYNNGVPVTLTNGASVDLAGTANNDITVTNTGCLGGEGTLTGEVKGAGTLTVTGTITATADRFTQTDGLSGGLKVNKNLIFTTKGLDVSAIGGFTQAAGSNVTVPASEIQSDINDATNAMFTNVNDAGKLDVDAGKLTLSGTVQEGKYYVLAAGGAVNAGFVTSNLWKPGNISFSDMVIAEFEYDTIASSSVALKVTNAVNLQEGNTSGLAAVQQGNISVAKEFTDEVANRLSFVQRPSLKGDKAEVRDVANTNKDDYKVESIEQGNANEVMPVQVADEDKYDKEVWASYIRTKETTEGMNLERIEGNNTAQYNGAVVGVDFYSSDKAIAGVAFSYTTGDIDSYSGEIATRNKSKYYGVSFYDRVTNGNNAIIYDIGYIKGDNDISQFYTGKETTADVKTDTYTAGVRYEAEFCTEKSRVVPFASFRYMRQNNKDYTNSHGTRFESSNQNLYIPKVGVAWTGEFTAPNSVCTWRPSVEAGYVWNLGDRSVDGNVLMGTTIAGIEYDTVDKSSYYAKAGMEFMCRNFTAGVFYRYLKGSAVRNNKWNVNVAWSF